MSLKTIQELEDLKSSIDSAYGPAITPPGYLFWWQALIRILLAKEKDDLIELRTHCLVIETKAGQEQRIRDYMDYKDEKVG